jgi:hypothetical protein
MKIVGFIAVVLMFMAAYGQSATLDGAYLSKTDGVNTLWLFKDGYSSKVIYEDDRYISTQGGPYTFDGQSLQITWEYDANPDIVGSQSTFVSSKSGTSLNVEGTVFVKQVSVKQDLDAVWRITGRQNTDQVISDIPRGDRKTIKILVDGYFQWIAINPAQKGFYGTGGGKYSFKEGQYTENIVFFSRDNSRVGAELNFKGELRDKAWHHSGLSSKGDPIYEIWSME